MMTAIATTAAILAAGLLGASACSAGESNGGATSTRALHVDSGGAKLGSDSSPPRAIDAGVTTMTKMTCDEARRAIEARQYVGWRGLPDACSAADLFGIPADDEWGTRRLGSESARQRLLDIEGYHRPLLSVRNDAVVLFDGAYPKLEGGWDALRADLGDPVERLDYQDGTIVVTGGERVYPDRGIAVFVSSDASEIYHVAVFAPTTIDVYKDRLRPSYAEKRVPHRR